MGYLERTCGLECPHEWRFSGRFGIPKPVSWNSSSSVVERGFFSGETERRCGNQRLETDHTGVCRSRPASPLRIDSNLHSSVATQGTLYVCACLSSGTGTHKRRKKGATALFRSKLFGTAACKYADCRKIAVLHCMRAACLMTYEAFNQAKEECASALEIHPRCMTVILRQARCNSKWQCRTEEAIANYKRWLDLAKDVESSGISLSPCLLQGLSTITPSDVIETERNWRTLSMRNVFVPRRQRAKKPIVVK